jgi:hypothetical protein
MTRISIDKGEYAFGEVQFGVGVGLTAAPVALLMSFGDGWEPFVAVAAMVGLGVLCGWHAQVAARIRAGVGRPQPVAVEGLAWARRSRRVDLEHPTPRGLGDVSSSVGYSPGGMVAAWTDDVPDGWNRM